MKDYTSLKKVDINRVCSRFLSQYAFYIQHHRLLDHIWRCASIRGDMAYTDEAQTAHTHCIFHAYKMIAKDILKAKTSLRTIPISSPQEFSWNDYKQT